MTKALDLVVEKVETMEEWVISMNGEFHPEQDIWSQVEEEHCDFSFHQDAHLESLIETLTYNGLSEQEIKQQNRAHYGSVIDFYSVGKEDEGLYIMAVGQR